MTTATPIIVVRDLGKRYDIYDRPQDRLWQALWRGRRRFHREFWALRDLSLAIRPGEAWGLIGRNGSGKSTLLQLIAGTLEPSSGEVTVSGRVSALLELGSGFNPDFTGRENIYLNAAVLGLTRADIDRRLEEILAFADIGDFIDQPLRVYSSGMTMRLAFAVAVCVEPEILIVDEALAVGDAGFQFKCLARIRRMLENGMTLLFVSHDLAMVKTFCQHAVYLRAGRAECIGTPDDAGEAYLRDLRNEQRQAHDGASAAPIRGKPSLGGEPGKAFGTDHGDILEACFADTGGQQEMFGFGTTIRIRVKVRYQSAVCHPCVALALVDQRHVVVAGRYAYLETPGEDGDWVVRTLLFDFDAKLAEGRYFVNLVLEDRLSEAQALLVDKQAGALSFQMLPTLETELLGIFDVGMQYRLADPEPQDALA